MTKSLFIFLLLLMITLQGIAQKSWNVYVFIGEDCPICNYMGKPLSALAEKFEDRVAFHAVFPLKNSNYKTSQLFKQQYEMLSFETLLDKDQSLTRKLGATITPEVIITDNMGVVHYRGRINNAYYAPGKMKHSSIKNDLDEALTTLLSGGSVAQPWPSPVGCYITMNVSR